MSFEEIRVITIVYIAVFLPLIILFLKKTKRNFTIIFTKSDKIKKSIIQKHCNEYVNSIDKFYNKNYFTSSSKTKNGREEILEYIEGLNS